MLKRFIVYLICFFSIVFNDKEPYKLLLFIYLILNACFIEYFYRKKNIYYFRIVNIQFIIWVLSTPLLQFLYTNISGKYSDTIIYYITRVGDFIVFYTTLLCQLGVTLVTLGELIKKRLSVSTFIFLPFYINSIFYIIDNVYDKFQSVYIIYILSALLGTLIGLLLIFDKSKLSEKIDYRKTILIILFWIVELNLLLENIDVAGSYFGEMSYLYPLLGFLAFFTLMLDSNRLLSLVYHPYFFPVVFILEVNLFLLERSYRFLPMYAATLGIFFVLAFFIAKYKFKVKSVGVN